MWFKKNEIGNIVSGGPILCQINSDGTPNLTQCYQPSVGDALVVKRTTLSASAGNLALSKAVITR
jgi:hypothetical protein